eukprot:CAMPEP_0169471230 /NCGR_PEP_ID=MMETSP1042-20121227/24483_1 /TAXON_ID=464988 /ORGANISM="Hemiselmis andersenii, Strain CCMP1180" /LENGTH=85 /DNA_ID=CAMNT_0009584921 /DNA_START=755 /DNA_END=1009 /DNA_ORIENTATION=-
MMLTKEPSLQEPPRRRAKGVSLCQGSLALDSVRDLAEALEGLLAVQGLRRGVGVVVGDVAVKPMARNRGRCEAGRREKGWLLRRA